MILEGKNLRRYQALLAKLQGMTSWRAIALACSEETRVADSAPPAEVAEAERCLGLSFPKDLKDLYSETNGVWMNSGAPVVLPIKELLTENLTMRAAEGMKDLYMPFDNLLIFGAAGNGDLWAFPIAISGRVNELNILAWDHETDARPRIASNLRDLLMRIGLGLLYDAFNA